MEPDLGAWESETWMPDPERRAGFGIDLSDWTFGVGIVGSRRIATSPDYPGGCPWFVTFRVGPCWLCITGREEGNDG